MRRLGLLVVLGACGSQSSRGGDINMIAGTQQSIDRASGQMTLVADDGTEVPVESSGNSFQVPLLPLTSTYHVMQDGEPVPDVVLHPSALVSFDWDTAAQHEAYNLLDPSTGETATIGSAGDLRWWFQQGSATFSESSHRVYVVGQPDDANSINKVYTIDAMSGELLADNLLTRQGAGQAPESIMAKDDGTLLSYHFSSAALDVYSIDPATGTETMINSVAGPFAGSQGENALDLEARRAYHILYVDSTDALSVISVDADSGASVGSALIKINGQPTRDLTGVHLDNHGRLIGFRWNGTAEEMVAVNPSSGEGQLLGTVGDLMTWTGLSVFNASTNQTIVFGENAGGTPKLYAMDMDSNQLAYDLPITKLPSKALLVTGAPIEQE